MKKSENGTLKAPVYDQEYLEAFIKYHSDRIYGFIYQKVNDRSLAEDIFQETFVQVINAFKVGKYREDGKLMPRVIKIAHNLVMDYYRKNKRVLILNEQDNFDIFYAIRDEAADMEGYLIDKQIKEDIKRMIRKLPASRQEVLDMQLCKNMTFKEISK